MLAYRHFPDRLERDEELELIKLAQRGNEEAKNKVVLHNMRDLSWMIHHQFGNVKNDVEDLFQVGLVGLVKAINRFDFDKDVVFRTLSAICMRNEILNELRNRRRNDRKMSDFDFTLNGKIDNPMDELFLFNIGDTTERLVDKMFFIGIKDCLNEQQIFMIESYYGINGAKKLNQPQIARALGLRQATVSRGMKVALKKIKWWLKEDGIKID